MKIAILGYGKMGKEIEKIAIDRAHKIELIIDNQSGWTEKQSVLKDCDVAIEFTNPQEAVTNIFRCFDAQVPVVVGTTGWYDEFEKVAVLCKKKNGTLFYSSNYSIGVNLFFEMNRKLARIMNSYPMYDVKIEETHHAQKIDTPSGTAIELAKNIIGEYNQKKIWVESKPSASQELEIVSMREGDVVGTHRVVWDSEIDQLSLCHEAKNRIGFALGAVLAAEFINERKGIFNMKDLLSL